MVQLLYRNGIYVIDEITPPKVNPVTDLMELGHVLELFLTSPPSEFEKYLVQYREPFKVPESNSYYYGSFQNLVLRSQLDAYHPSLGTFDLKTRATLPIRKDLSSYKQHLWYEIKQEKGYLESFEREYFDMVRGAFLKYSIQVRIGSMDGIFVAYHNTQSMFGFEYISLEDMDISLYGSKAMAESLFNVSLQILNELCLKVVEYFPEQDTKIFFGKANNHVVDVFIEPIQPKKGQVPIHLVLSVNSLVDGVLTKNPIITESIDW
jgi:hypothetical protein